MKRMLIAAAALAASALFAIPALAQLPGRIPQTNGPLTARAVRAAVATDSTTFNLGGLSDDAASAEIDTLTATTNGVIQQVPTTGSSAWDWNMASLPKFPYATAAGAVNDSTRVVGWLVVESTSLNLGANVDSLFAAFDWSMDGVNYISGTFAGAAISGKVVQFPIKMDPRVNNSGYGMPYLRPRVRADGNLGDFPAAKAYLIYWQFNK